MGALSSTVASNPSPSRRARMTAWLRHGQFLPWLVLAASLAVTQQLWSNARHEALQVLQTDFDFRVNDVSLRIKQRMELYEQVLFGTQGLFAASRSVERDEFRTFVAALSIDENLPGIQGVAFSLFVPAAQQDQHIAAMHKEGYPAYTIKPGGKRDITTSIIYIEPFDGRNQRAFGYDMYTEPVRRAAMAQARDTAQIAISGKVRLLQEDGRSAQAGFLMYLPVYKNGVPHGTLAERRANLIGWVYAPFRMDDLMAGIFGGGYALLDIEIYDGKEMSDQTLMHDADKIRRDHGKSHSRFQATRHIKIADHTWTMRISSLPSFEVKLDKFKLELIAMAGIIASLLLALMTWLVMRAWVRGLLAIQAEQGMNNERSLLAILEQLFNEIYVFDAQTLRFSYVNRSALRNLGYTLEEMQAKTPYSLKLELSEEAFRAMIEPLRRGEKKRIVFETTHTRANGSRYPVAIRLQLIKSNEQSVFLAVVSDITERKVAEQSIHSLAYYDVLTGLPNRTLLHDRLGQLLAASHRDQQKFALLFLDLDRFKHVNDSMGHAIGDQLLQTVALRLQECVREGDTVSRIGGDEFIILLRETDAAGAALVADKILKVLAVPYAVGGLQIVTHASIGISIYPDHADDIDSLIKYADVAMYQVKGEGCSNFQLFTPEMNFHAEKLFSMEKDLRLALERNEFILHYQPQINLKYGRVCGAEALIRWQHPEQGLVSPAEFIAVAAETGQIVPIGEWVLRTACTQLAEWRRQGMAVFPVSVNLSIRQLLQPNLAQQVIAILEETGLGPGDLEFEITEGIMMGDTQAAMVFLTRMHELGVRLSIDDFGTGYSSLNYMKKMPLDRLKVDRSFVRDIVTDANDAAIVISIITLGRQFNLQVVAEGVETLEQLDFLRRCGCDEIQGFYFSHPLPADEFAQFIKSEPKLG